MGERAKIILNDYTAAELLKRDAVDLDKFYTTDLKILIEAARKELKNLQQENERLKEQLNCKEVYSNYMPENTEFIIMSKTDYDRQELDYKSRNEEAIKYIKEWQSFPHTNCTTHNELKNLLNILNGGDDNE